MKTIALFLLIALMGSLTSCGSDDGGTSTTSGTFSMSKPTVDCGGSDCVQ